MSTPTTPGAPAGRERRFQWPVPVLLAAVWVLLWGEVTVTTVLGGLLVAVIVMAVFPLPPIVFGGRVRPIGLVRLLAIFAKDLVVASVVVAAQVLQFGRQPSSALIEVDLRSESDLYLTITAEFLSLVPGSLVIEARRSTRTLFLHVFGVSDLQDVERARQRALQQEERVIRAFASQEELEKFERRVGVSGR